MTRESRSGAYPEAVVAGESSFVDELERLIRRHATDGVEMNGRAFEIRSQEPDVADWEVMITELVK